MNLLGALALLLSLGVFILVHTRLRPCSAQTRWLFLGLFSLAAILPLLFAVYYLHVLPEWAWFYTLRSWPGTELLGVFLGGAAGAAASFLPRILLGFPLGIALVLGLVPYLKPLIGPLPESAFRERSIGAICLQSTSSTCGPASVTTVLRHLGAEATEHAVARAAFSYSGGTEAWYLARYIRSRSFIPRFKFRDTFSPEAGLPAVVEVRLGGLGHFIAVLEISDGYVTFADPLRGPERLPLEEFRRRYIFTGFHLVITPA